MKKNYMHDIFNVKFYCDQINLLKLISKTNTTNIRKSQFSCWKYSMTLDVV